MHTRIRRAYFWTILGSAARYIAGFGISVVLARLLTPQDYGLIGIVSVFVEFLIVFYDQGLGNAVMHYQEKDSHQERATYFTAALILGAVSTALLWVASPFIAAFYNEPPLVLLLRVMSFILIIGSIKTISSSILARDLRFSALSFADIIASVAGGVVAIIMAFFGSGVWSLVANLYLFVALQGVVYARWARPTFAWPLEKEAVGRLWRYGAPTTGSSLLRKFSDNADYLVVGKLLGATSLGFYTVAFRLAMLINDRISAVINRVAFPSFANLKNEPEKVVAHWFAVTRRVTVITFPLLAWLAFNAEDFVRLVLGDKWLPAVLPLQFLCVMTAVKVLTNIVAQLMGAIGHPAMVFRYDVLTAIVLPIAFLVGCVKGGLLGMGIVWCTVFPLLRFLFLLGARKALPFSLLAYAKNIADSVRTSALCIVFMLPTFWLLPSSWLRLGLSSVLWAAAVLVSVAVSPRLRALVADVVSTFASSQFRKA